MAAPTTQDSGARPGEPPTPPGGPERPLRADARRNRRRVLEAAQLAFAEHGPSVPLDEIARRAGVGPGTVHRHFPSKDALVRAVVTQRLRRISEEARALARVADPGEAFFGFLTAAIAHILADQTLCHALCEERAAPATASPAAGRAEEELAGTPQGLLTRAQAAGRVRSDIGVADVRAMLAGCAATEEQTTPGHPTRPARLLAVLRASLRPDRTAPTGAEVPVPTAQEETPLPDAVDDADDDEEAAVAGLAPFTDQPFCAECGTRLRTAPTGRRARFCGAACRQRAHRRRTRG